MAVDFVEKTITVYDSMYTSVVEESEKDHVVSYGDNILSHLVDKKLCELNENDLKSLCSSTSIKPGQNKIKYGSEFDASIDCTGDFQVSSGGE